MKKATRTVRGFSLSSIARIRSTRQIFSNGYIIASFTKGIEGTDAVAHILTSFLHCTNFFRFKAKKIAHKNAPQRSVFCVRHDKLSAPQCAQFPNNLTDYRRTYLKFQFHQHLVRIEVEDRDFLIGH